MTTRDDEPFEQVLMDAAAGYGAPSGEAPREEMWAAIRARRTTPRLAATPAAPRHVPRTWVWMGMAATLLLGVAVGRFAWQRNAQQVVVSALPASSAPTAGVPVPNAPENQGAPGAAAAAPVSAAPVAPRATRNGRILEGAGSTTYSLVAVRHLADVEALLTSYSASAADARTDSLLGAWAKTLLSNTRLLLDSPAANDPVRARLLGDLEVILVQLVQRSPVGAAEGRSAVERTLRKHQLIPRLRSAVPASLHSGTD